MAEALRERPVLAPEAGAGPARRGPRFVERSGLCLIQLIARPGQAAAVGRVLGLDLPSQPNTTRTERDVTLFCLRPDDWLTVTPDAKGRQGGVALEARKQLAGLAAVIDQSHGRVVLRLAGEGARDLLQQGCNIDLDPAAFGEEAMAQTGINGTAVLLHGVAADQFDLYVARSFAASLAVWLEHHGATLETSGSI